MMVYEKETNAIKVSVSPVYLEDESDPSDHHYVWAYHVRIENTGKETVQLMSRTWNITDGQGRMREIKGAGVVGEQPVLEPGDSFEYTSGTPLITASGYMDGCYHMVTQKGKRLEVSIPGFFLESNEPAQWLH